MTNYRLLNIFLLPLFTLLLCSADSFSQCEITDLVVTVNECDETDKFSAELNFNFNETGANGFQILGNGNNYGTFQYADLPVTIEGLTGNCEIEYEFIVRDVIDPTCAAFINYGTVCCDDVCSISIVDFETTECINNTSYGIVLNLEYEFTENTGFLVTINGEVIGEYSYEGLPLNIDDIASGVEGINTLTICDLDDPECCATQDFLYPCVCSMTNITTKIVDCNSEDTTYYTIIDFDHVATNDSFQMGYSNSGTNIFLGTFAYSDLPITAGPIYLSENEQEILIVDTDDFFCFSSAYLGIVDDCTIECQLFNVFAEAYMCEEGFYFMDVEFEAKDIEGSTFEILVDGINYGTFEYGENVYSIGPIPSNCDLAPTVVIQDSGQESCSDFFNLDEPICCPPDCNFTSFAVTTACSPTILTINGEFENNGAMFSAFYFIELLGTSYGPFQYNDFMFSLQIGLLADGEYTITINDSADPECKISTTFEVQCDEEPCLIFNVFAEASECEGNSFYVDVEFDFAGEVSDSFEILGNGLNYGTFAYGEQFYTVGPLESDCVTLNEFLVSDLIFEGCNSFYGFEEPICCGSDCVIENIEILEYVCEDSARISSFVLDFDYENTTSDMFEVRVGIFGFGPFNYTELPVTIEGDFDFVTTLTIEISDVASEICSSFEVIEVECSSSDCSISEISTEFIECNDEQNAYFVNLDFLHTGEGQAFELYVNDTLFNTSNYSDLPIQLGPIPIGLEANFIVKDRDIEDCSEEFQVYLEQCETSLKEAEFSNIEILQSGKRIHIVNGESEMLQFQLYSTSGILIDKVEIGATLNSSFDTSLLPTGLYLLNIVNQKSQKTIKILVL